MQVESASVCDIPETSNQQMQFIGKSKHVQTDTNSCPENGDNFKLKYKSTVRFQRILT